MEVIEFYIYLILRTIAFSLSALFLPIYLYVDKGYSLFQISIFFTINQLLFSIFVPFSGYIIKKIGVKHSIALHLPFISLFWYLLRFLSGNFVSDLPLIFFMFFIRTASKAPTGAAQSLFIQNNLLKSGHFGHSLAIKNIILIMAAIISPICGGIIAMLFGFDMFFNVAIVIMLSAAIPFFLTKDKYFDIKYTPSKLFSFLKHEISKDYIASLAGLAIPEVVLWIFWPLFVFLIVGSTFKLGFVTSISSLIAIVATHFIGKKLDGKNPEKILKKITYMSTTVFLVRTIFATPLVIMLMDAINKVAKPLLNTSFEKFQYEYLEKNKSKMFRNAIARSFVFEFSMLLGFIVLSSIFYIFSKLGITVGYIHFVGIFVLFGLPYLLVPKVVKSLN